MKKFKKAALTAASYVSVAALAVGGTLAYWTANDEEMNVMTVGDGIDIELVEQQRNEDGSALEDFVDGKMLMPIVGSAQTDPKVDVDGITGLTTAENYVDKIVSVTNTGNNAAFVRVLVAVPSALDDSDSAGNNILHWNFGDTNGDGAYSYDWKFEEASDIDGVNYNIYSFVYKEALLAGQTTSDAAIKGFYLDANVDCQDGKYTINGNAIDYDFSGGILIPVYAQAVQSSDTKTAAEMFELAKMPINPWEDANIVTDDNDVIAEGSKKSGYVPTAGETIDNMVVSDGTGEATNLRALYNATPLTGDLTINDSYFCGQYGMNVTASETANAIFTVNNSAFYGWSSFSGFASASFTDCIFGEGTVDSTGNAYNRVRSYDVATFTNCEFKGSLIDVLDEKGKLVGDITLVNCTYNGKAITAEMLPDIVDNWGVVDGVDQSVRIG